MIYVLIEVIVFIIYSRAVKLKYFMKEQRMSSAAVKVHCKI